MTLSPAAERWRERGRIVALPFPGGTLDVFVLTANDDAPGTPLLLLHGFPSSSYDFHLCWGALGSGRRLITLDLPGFGFSAKPADFSYSLIEQADVVIAVLRQLGVTRADLFCHDMGTSVGTELLARRQFGNLPFEIDRLILMNGSVHSELTSLALSQRLLRARWLGPVFARLANPRMFAAQLRRILGRPAEVAPEELSDMFALVRLADGNLRLPRIIGYIEERKRFARRWIGALERFDRPALVLWGVKDPVAVLAIADLLAGEIPGARYVKMDELGHYPQLEDPARVAAEVNAFLAVR